MNKPRLGLVVAADCDGNIGYQNTIPWRLRGDLKNFKAITMGQVVIMGRKTYESLPKALEGRISIVISSHPIICHGDDDVHIAHSVEEAIDIGSRFGTDWIYFIGGAKIYEEAIPLVERAHITLVHIPGKYDTKINNFKFPVSEWELVDQVAGPVTQDEESGMISTSHTYLTFQRKKS